jgi:hypothetical protein
MEQVDSWVTKSQEEDQAPMPKVRTEYVPMHDSEESMAEQRGSGGREQKVKIPKYELREQKGEDEVTALPARGSRPRLVWHEVEEEDEILYVTDTDSEDDPIEEEEEKVVGPQAKYLLNPYFVE